jgi:predicted  nucleic acid-binding Zn-ribbon protein
MRALLIVFLIAAGAGCAPAANRDTLTKEVLQADPAFQKVLDRYRDVVNRVQTLDRELALKRATIEQNIAKLRQELLATAASVKSKTAELKKRIEPELERLALALSMAWEELRAKQAQRASLGRSISRLKKTVKDAGSGLSPAERSRHEAQMEEMARDASRLDQEMAALKQHMRLLKTKLVLLKL